MYPGLLVAHCGKNRIKPLLHIVYKIYLKKFHKLYNVVIYGILNKI